MKLLKQRKKLTIKEYLKELLVSLWEQGEGFSGKRPFGNSGWEWDLYKPLIVGGAVKGVVDEYGDIDEFDSNECDKLLLRLVAECFDTHTKDAE